MLATSFNDCITGTPEATMNTSSFVCTYLIEPAANYHKNWSLHFYAGTHAGSTRQVTEYNTSTYAVKFLPALASNVVANCTFQMHGKHTWQEYKDAINYAIERAKDTYLLNKVDETTTLSANTYEYSVPTGFRYIESIFVEDTTNDDTYYDRCLVDPNKWYILKHPTSPKIKFRDSRFSIGTDLVDQKLRVIGQSLQATLTNDDDTCYLPMHVIMGLAKAYILENEGKISDALSIRNVAEKYLRAEVTPPLPDSRTVFEV